MFAICNVWTGGDKLVLGLFLFLINFIIGLGLLLARHAYLKPLQFDLLLALLLLILHLFQTRTYHVHLLLVLLRKTL